MSFGFNADADTRVNEDATMMSGLRKDFKLPENALEVVIDKKNSTSEAVKYVSLNWQIETYILKEQDDLIRTFIKDLHLQTYTSRPSLRVFYIGKSRVIVCAPLGY